MLTRVKTDMLINDFRNEDGDDDDNDVLHQYNLSTAILTRLKTEMLVRQESMISQVSQRGVPSNNLVSGRS